MYNCGKMCSKHCEITFKHGCSNLYVLTDKKSTRGPQDISPLADVRKVRVDHGILRELGNFPNDKDWPNQIGWGKSCKRDLVDLLVGTSWPSSGTTSSLSLQTSRSRWDRHSLKKLGKETLSMYMTYFAVQLKCITLLKGLCHQFRID